MIKQSFNNIVSFIFLQVATQLLKGIEEKPDEIMDVLLQYPEISEILAAGSGIDSNPTTMTTTATSARYDTPDVVIPSSLGLYSSLHEFSGILQSYK